MWLLWSLLRVTGLGERPHVARFWDILGNSSSLSSGEALYYETKHPSYHSHKPSFMSLGEQLSYFCLSFPIRKVGNSLLTLEEH